MLILFNSDTPICEDSIKRFLNYLEKNGFVITNNSRDWIADHKWLLDDFQETEG